MAILSTNVVNQMKNLVQYGIRRSGKQACLPEVQRLNTGEVRRHAAAHQTMLVVAGTAWVSVAGHDYVVRVGDSLKLPYDPYPALVSSVKCGRLTYQLV